MMLQIKVIRSFFSVIRVRQFLLLMLVIPVLTQAEQWDIEQLMQELSQVRSSHAFFVEKKSMAMLTVPIESSGELIYTAPDHLEKRTLKPKSESIILDKDILNIELSSQQSSPIGHQTNNRHYQLQLQNHPEIAVFIDSIRGTLAGDLKTLQQNYLLSLMGNADDWTLSLNPSNDKMLAMVNSIDISGTHTTIHRIEITQTDGDSSVMLIEQ